MPRQAKQKTESDQNQKLIEELMEQNRLLREQLLSIQQPKQEITEYAEEKESNVNEIEETIREKEYIPVVSLNPHRLILTTQAKGGGKAFTFYKFGEIKKIMYEDLASIMENHPEFTSDGRFYIMDKRVIRNHGLNDAYSKVLTKDQIEKILNNQGNALDLYNSANDTQKRIIVDFLTRKVRDNPDSVDMNLVDKISRLSGTKIQERAEEARELLKDRPQ